MPPDQPQTEVLVVADAWRAAPDAEAIIQHAIEMTAGVVNTGIGVCELAVMLTDDAGIRTLNQNWRGQDKATNVLSFPALPPTGALKPGDPPRTLGDIAIAYETARREADAEARPFRDHLTHLTVHGYLHLVGYDHENEADAEEMEMLERDILHQMGIADPYADLDPAG